MMVLSLGWREGRQPRRPRGFPDLLAPDSRTVDRGRRLIDPIFLFEFPRQILLGQILKVFIGQ